MTLGTRIAALRRERGLSQEALGELVGVSRQAVSKWESDSALPDVNNCVALSRAFGITLAQLLELEEETAPSRELTQEQLEMAETIAKKYLESLPRPKGWRQQRKWPWVLAAAVVLVVALGAAWWGHQLDQTVSRMDGQMANIQNTVGDTVEEQVNAALEQVTSLVEFFDYSVVQVDLAENAVTFDLAVQLRQRTADTPVILAARSAGETVSVQGEDQGGDTFAAQITCPLSDTIDFSLTFQMDGENRTQTIGQAIQMAQDYSLQPVVKELDTSYEEKKLDGDHFPAGTVVPLEYNVTFYNTNRMVTPEDAHVRAWLGVFVNDQLDHWVDGIQSWSIEHSDEFYLGSFWSTEVDLSGLSLNKGDIITLGLRVRDGSGHTRTQMIWMGHVKEDDGSLIGGVVKEDKPYAPVEEAWQKLRDGT